MRFLHLWLDLEPAELARLVLPVALLALSIFLPGRRTARWTAIAVAGSLLLAEGVAPEGGFRYVWVFLWLVVARLAGGSRGPGRGAAPPRSAGIEAWTIGLPLGLVLLALLVAAVAREDLSAPHVRRATLGVALIGVGLLQLMLRRDALRAMLAFGALGMGLNALDLVAYDVLLPTDRTSAWAMPAATAAAITLVARLAYVRRRDAGSSWVSDAHDLHD